jgi:hypothetical protein
MNAPTPSPHWNRSARPARAGAAEAWFDDADDDSKRIVRVGGAVAPSTEVGHTHGGHGNDSNS